MAGPQTITITLYVDTQNITLANTDQYCNFGQDVTKISNCDYTVEAEPGDLIVWQAIPKPATTDTVKILAIWGRTNRPDRRRSDYVMGEFIRNQDGDRSVAARVVGKQRQIQSYKLFFMVSKNGVPSGIYFIDPKIAIKPSAR
ncbi:MAG: hypothetical protein U5K79_18760 [Cyclobacteriaceae bacterium]|nr:hypothetical protein [Cyclobacteriaceae bacterium]